MQRRTFIRIVGGSTFAWPFALWAQQPPVQVIGFLSSASLEASQFVLQDFRSGLAQEGYVEGKNVTIEYRFADGQYDRLPALAEDLVRRQVRVVATSGGSTSALAIHAVTKTIPIVSLTGGDMVKLGLAASLSHPGGNVTGVAQLLNDAEIKRFELLHEIVPEAKTIGYLANPKNARFDAQTLILENAAEKLGVKFLILNATSQSEIDKAFATVRGERVDGIIVGADPFFFMRVTQIVDLAATHRVPAIYFLREYARSGGLVSYGTRLGDALRQVGVYTGRVLKGAKPAELPIVQQSEKIELLVNLKTAKALGINIPTSVLLRADEVIE
ncbi:MAG TPA: ABC transporter substrate-binding protein [Bradyrhizobium sp.]|jgi:putative ABC transport system substrate-binding protein|nr:ABC transporter substrate-binding protein [Bradyrhizobium sp.]